LFTVHWLACVPPLCRTVHVPHTVHLWYPHESQNKKLPFLAVYLYNAGINGLYLVQPQDCRWHQHDTLSTNCPLPHYRPPICSGIQCRLCTRVRTATYCPHGKISTGRDGHKQAREGEKNDSLQASYDPLHTASTNKPWKLNLLKHSGNFTYHQV
jgi:hypothetical protein